MANEKRLIDANAFFKEADKALFMGFRAEERKRNFLDMISAMLDNCPTVEAVEVIHAHWEDEHGGKYANPRYRCSVCKERALYKFERDLLDNWKEVQALTDYCPNCGAKMDGGNEDG